MQHRPQTLEATLANVLIKELAGDQTSPQPLLSTPYERVDIEVPAPELRQTRRRAATIPREDLARRVQAREAAESFDAASTLRFSAPYARIEVQELESIVPRAALVSGSWEAGWFVAPDDAQDEPVTSDDSARWLWFVAGAMLVAFAVSVIALL